MTREENIQQYTEASEWFLTMMRNKLKKNAHKGDWRTFNINELVKLLKLEVFELDDALESEEVDIDNIIDECVDISNFALFIADVVYYKTDDLKDYQKYLELEARNAKGDFDQFRFGKTEEEKSTDKKKLTEGGNTFVSGPGILGVYPIGNIT